MGEEFEIMSVSIQKTIEELLTTKEDAYLPFCDIVEDLNETQKSTLYIDFTQ